MARTNPARPSFPVHTVITLAVGSPKGANYGFCVRSDFILVPGRAPGPGRQRGALSAGSWRSRAERGSAGGGLGSCFLDLCDERRIDEERRGENEEVTRREDKRRGEKRREGGRMEKDWYEMRVYKEENQVEARSI